LSPDSLSLVRRGRAAGRRQVLMGVRQQTTIGTSLDLLAPSNGLALSASAPGFTSFSADVTVTN